ncbi:MAG TPA: M20/M25/M40 family metallo-hydrolase [Bryobacteraceae bacterium]|jgi:acetylornithine deacetylase/succinyl-diaminopimelate desuccinylase-like protein|nr:M20/M25/M40 family metallo-hydrolase [Bryobacteraceae bacterium]
MAVDAAQGVMNLNGIAETREVRECLQWFTREKHWINDMHLQLCRVPAPTFLEGERAAWFVEQLRGLGWDASADRAGNVIATMGDGPYVALTAHLDTVIAPRSKEEIAVEADGRFRGPGVSDNGAGLAALLAVARAWKNVRRIPDLKAGLMLVANVGEEGEGNLVGMRYLCKQSPMAKKIAAFVVVDGANTDHVTTQALGSRRFEVTFSGPGGHSWSDYGLGNPVHALCRAVALFSETRLDGTPKSAVNVGLIEGGSSVNAIAQVARAKVDIRSESNEKIEELVELLSAAVDRARDLENQRAAAGKVSAKVKEIGSRPAATLPEKSPILQYIRAVDAHLGIRSHLDCSSTDANIPISMGIPAIAIGAGGVGGGAHTTQEWFRPEGRDLGLKRILLLLILLLREPGGKH